MYFYHISSKQYPDYEYSVFIKHKPASSQFAHNVKVRFFLPEYVVFQSMVPGYSSRISQKKFGGSRMFDVISYHFLTFFHIFFGFLFHVNLSCQKLQVQDSLQICLKLRTFFRRIKHRQGVPKNCAPFV